MSNLTPKKKKNRSTDGKTLYMNNVLYGKKIKTWEMELMKDL